MISSLDSTSELFLADLGRVQDRLASANRQVSSGKRISSASDAPDQIDTLLQLRALRSHNTQVQANLNLATTAAQAADDALSSCIKLLDRALVLAAQASNSTLNAADRQSIAQEAEGLQEQMVAYSRTVVQGRYIFSGDEYNSPAYQLDLTAPDGVLQVVSAKATTRIEDAAGGSLQASRTAREIFDPRNSDGTAADGNVFAALNTLRLALLNNDSDALANSITLIKSASERLNSQQAFYGSVQNRIRDALNFAQNYDVQLKSEVSQIEDADVAAAALEITQATTQLQAAFQLKARIPHTSLFDYLG